MSALTPAEAIAKLKAAYDAGTKEPWRTDEYESTLDIAGDGKTLRHVAQLLADEHGSHDVTHIVSAHNSFPALLAVAEAARQLELDCFDRAEELSLSTCELAKKLSEALAALSETVQ